MSPISTVVHRRHTLFIFIILTLPATLGALPPPQLLNSVSLTNSNQTAPTTLMPLTLSPHNAVRSSHQPTHEPRIQTQLTQGAPHLPAVPSGLILSPADVPFPRKLVEKVIARQFVDMRELLPDNISLLHRLESVQGPIPVQTLGPTRPRLRNVTTISTWVYCFLGYMAILTTDPRTRDQLAYARLIIREAQRHGGRGWLDYGRAFRQQAAVDPSIRWNTLFPGLQASTILGQTNSQASTFCTLCRGADHVQSQCALAYLYPQPMRASAQVRQTSNRPARRAENICKSWNKGACIFPNTCTYRHVCMMHQLHHMARDCPKTPQNSFYKQVPSQSIPKQAAQATQR